MSEKVNVWRVRATALVFALTLAGLGAANLLTADPVILNAERRRAAVLPPLTGESVMSGTFMKEFDSYALDSFVWRDGFRRVKAALLFGMFRQTDNNGIYVSGGHAAKIETLRANSIRDARRKIAAIAARDWAGTPVHFALIPDKGYYLDGDAPGMDYGVLEALLRDVMPGVQCIDIKAALEAGSFYATDLHWNQARLGAVTETLRLALGLPELDLDWTETAYAPFYGGYYGQSALPLPAETLTTLGGEPLRGVTARALNPKDLVMEDLAVYDPERFGGVDPYDIFLGGPQPLVVLTNENAATERELVLYRDSFGSSLAPLLTPYYAKITLVDLRYFAPSLLSQFAEEGEDAQVLFLLSAQVLNNSGVLKGE